MPRLRSPILLFAFAVAPVQSAFSTSMAHSRLRHECPSLVRSSSPACLSKPLVAVSATRHILTRILRHRCTFNSFFLPLVPPPANPLQRVDHHRGGIFGEGPAAEIDRRVAADDPEDTLTDGEEQCPTSSPASRPAASRTQLGSLHLFLGRKPSQTGSDIVHVDHHKDLCRK